MEKYVNGFNPKEEAKKLPETPGVYLMHNQMDEIIYVGKAINLKSRVSQYFHHNEQRQKRIQQMIANIQWFEVIRVETELEALILESNLIKEYRPRYNAALRDDENHPYLRVDELERFPKITVTTDNQRDAALYIGPFYKSMEIEKALDWINKYYGLRTCNKKLNGDLPEGHPCMYFSLGQCMGCCTGKVDTWHYHEQLKMAIHFLITSEEKEIREDLEAQMQAAVETLAFERAGQCKRMLSELDEITTRLDFSLRESNDNTDLFSIASNEKAAVILLYIIRNRRLSGRDCFIIDRSDRTKQSDGQILRAFVERFYQGSPYIPSNVILTEHIKGKSEVEEQLTRMKGKPVRCSCPRSGENGRFVKLTKENARKLLEKNERIGLRGRKKGDCTVMFGIMKKKDQIEQLLENKELMNIPNKLVLDTKTDKANISGISIPIAKLATLGAGVSSLLPALQTVPKKSETLYRLANEEVGDTLKVAKNGNFWGAFKTANGDSKFVQLQKVDLEIVNGKIPPIDPATMMMAVALFSIEQQLGKIEKIERDILVFLETEKESEIEADVKTLYDILSKYKTNWDNEHFIASNHKMVLDIQRTARKNMISYHKKVTKLLNDKQPLLSLTQVNAKLKDMINKFQYYRLSLISLSLASLIEIMLSGNFKEENITAIKTDLENASMEYRELFGQCSEYLEKKSKGSLETMFLKGIGDAGKAAGNFIGNIPVVKNGPVDELLQDGGSKLKKEAGNISKEVSSKFAKLSNPENAVFIEKMSDMIQIYNHTESIAFDSEKIYLIA